jgi:hypothetical protein
MLKFSFSKIRLFMWREPLVHFVFAAACLLLLHRLFVKPAIEVSPQLVSGLTKEYENRLGREAAPAEVKRLVHEYLEDEVLYREAINSGLIHDNHVRTLLVETMRKSLRPVVSPPTDAELTALRAETPEIYRLPAKLSFEHVTFKDQASVPVGLLETLQGGAPMAGLGDPIQISNPLPATFQPQLEHMFGADFTAALLKCKVGVWSGPIPSLRGVHFVKVITHEEAHDMPLEQIRSTLASQWTTVEENASISKQVLTLQNSYRVHLPPGFSAP